MGCCICRPKKEVTEDPDVVMYTKVGGSAILYPSHSHMLSNFSGLLYVKDDQLCYEAACGSRLYCQCFREAWHLSEIKHIRVVHGETVVVPGNKVVHVISLNPGLKITLQKHPHAGTFTFVTAIADAENVSTQLAELANSSRR